MSNRFKEEAKEAGHATVWWFWGLAIAMVSLGIIYAVQPYFVAKETQTTRQSNAYITSKQSALRTFKSDYDNLATRKASLPNDKSSTQISDALDAQMAGIIRQMKEEADKIPGNVPSDIVPFLSTNR